VGGGTTDTDINVFGPIARDADDLDLLLGVLAGPEPERETAWHLELPPPRRTTVKGAHIGLWLEDPECPMDREVLALLRRAADRLADAGAKIEEAHPPVDFGHQVSVFNQLFLAAMSQSLPTEVAEAISGSHLRWLQADEDRAALRQVWARWFEDFDLLMCPVLGVAAFPHNQEGEITNRVLNVNGEPAPHMALLGWIGLVGVVGLPSAVAPAGRTAAGLPVGVQLVAPYLRDRDAVRAARIVTEILDGYQPPPLDTLHPL
jgi:amidase